MTTALLKLENISYAYEDQPPALQDVSVTIASGERIAVIGGNGAGKSTFFLCCNGVLQPHQGQIFLHGDEIRPKKKDLNRLRQHVGIVFQDPNQQLIGATVEEEISFGPMNLDLKPNEVAQRVNNVITRMGLETLRERPPHYLSGGEKRRLSIADVLAMHPELIILDEPTAFLDVKNRLLLEQSLNDLHLQGKALMVATHDMDFAYRWATRVLVFHQGRLMADNTPEAIFADADLLKTVEVRLPMICELTPVLRGRGLLGDVQSVPKSLDALIHLLDLP